MILDTRHLVLRPQEQADAPALFTLLHDARTMRFWSRPPIAHQRVVEELVREQQDAMAAGLCRYWTVLEQDQVIGSVDISLIADGSGELGFVLRRDRWGLGLASEAVAAVIAQGFGAMNLKGLVAAVQSGNAAAARVLVKNGFELLESRPDMVLPDGQRADCAFYVRRP